MPFPSALFHKHFTRFKQDFLVDISLCFRKFVSNVRSDAADHEDAHTAARAREPPRGGLQGPLHSALRLQVRQVQGRKGARRSVLSWAWTLLIIILSTPASENQFDLSYIWYRPLIITQSRNWVLGKSPNFNRCQLITAIIPSHHKEACDDILNCPLITNHLVPRVTELVEMMRWLDYLLYTSPRHCRQLSLLIKSGW